MKTEAMVLRATGGPEVIERAAVELAEPGPREVRVRVRAVALNHLDLWTRRGLPHLKYDFPHRLGADIAGEVEALGPGARHAAVGQRVAVSPGISCGVCEACLAGDDNLCRSYRILGESAQGGYARHIVVPDTNVIPLSGSLDFVHAASIPLTALTAWQMVVRRGQVRPGQTVLVHAAGSGVSAMAIQMAKMFGATVIATTTQEEKVERARALGADHVVVSTRDDFVRVCKELTSKRGVDVVVEHVGGDVFQKSVLATAWGGRIVTCGATAGFHPEIDLRHIFFRQIQVLGSTMGRKSDLFEVFRHVEAGTLRPVVDRVMPLWEARAAHEALEARRAFGKIVLEVD